MSDVSSALIVILGLELFCTRRQDVLSVQLGLVLAEALGAFFIFTDDFGVGWDDGAFLNDDLGDCQPCSWCRL